MAKVVHVNDSTSFQVLRVLSAVVPDMLRKADTCPGAIDIWKTKSTEGGRSND